MAKKKASAESTVRTIRRQTRKKYSAEDKIRIVIEGLRGESTVAELCRKEGISESLYYSWSKRHQAKRRRKRSQRYASLSGPAQVAGCRAVSRQPQT